MPVSRTFDIAQHLRQQYGRKVDDINFSDNIFIKEVLTEVIIDWSIAGLVEIQFLVNYRENCSNV